MRIIQPLRRFVFGTVLLSLTCAGVAQGPPGHDRDNPPPGHGGMPPGQAKKYGYDRGHERRDHDRDEYRERGHRREHENFRFRDEDRGRFYAHYRYDADRWRHRHRPVFVPGGYIDRVYVVRPVPQTYWVGVAPPPPPGYTYGYYGGYVVAYNPTTRVIADVVDLVGAVTGH